MDIPRSVEGGATLLSTRRARVARDRVDERSLLVQHRAHGQLVDGGRCRIVAARLRGRRVGRERELSGSRGAQDGLRVRQDARERHRLRHAHVAAARREVPAFCHRFIEERDGFLKKLG